MQGRMLGRHLKNFIFSFFLFTTVMIVNCGGSTNSIQPLASIPLPEESDTGGIVISEPGADGNISITGPEESLPDDVDIIIQVADTDDDDFFDEADETDDAAQSDDEDDTTTTTCALDLPYCPEMSSQNRCRQKTNTDGSFSATVPAKISSSVVISYVDAASCGEVKTYESKVVSGGTTVEIKPQTFYPTPEIMSAKTAGNIEPNPQPTYQPLPLEKPKSFSPQNFPQQEVPKPEKSIETNDSDVVQNPQSPKPPLMGPPLSGDSNYLPSKPKIFPNSTTADEEMATLFPLLPPPITVNNLDEFFKDSIDEPAHPFVDLFPFFRDKYDHSLVTWIEAKGSFVASHKNEGTMTLPKRVTFQGNPIYHARLAFAESQASFTEDEILDTCWCQPFMKPASIYTRLFFVREPLPEEPIAAELFVADDYDAQSPFTNLPIRRVPLLDVAEALENSDLRAIRTIPFVGVTEDTLLLVVGVRETLGAMRYFLVMADRFDGLCDGVAPLEIRELFSGPDHINVHPAQRLENDGHVADYLMFFDPITTQRWAFDLEELGLVPLPIMVNMK